MALNDTAIILFYFWKLLINTNIYQNFIISFSKFLKSILISKLKEQY